VERSDLMDRLWSAAEREAAKWSCRFTFECEDLLRGFIENYVQRYHQATEVDFFIAEKKLELFVYNMADEREQLGIRSISPTDEGGFIYYLPKAVFQAVVSRLCPGFFPFC
jgi:hypothetical protein